MKFTTIALFLGGTQALKFIDPESPCRRVKDRKPANPGEPLENVELPE